MKPVPTTTESKAVDSVAELDILEEDDEFEEFPQEVWDEPEDALAEDLLWEDNWEDDDADQQFVKHLREELEKHKGN